MIASPCINICRLDPASGLCQGCLRTLDEIAGWSRIDDDARLGILAAVNRRREQNGLVNNQATRKGDAHD